jgi:hypothetical protein
VALIDLMKGRNLKKLFIMKKYLLLTGILFFYQIAFSQNVGINTATPTASLDVNGDVVFRTATLIVADGITLALDVNTTKFSYYRMEGPTANFTLAGIAAGADGRLLTLFNRSGFTMQLNNEDASAAPTDRIVTGTNADITISDKGMVSFQFDGNEGKWIVKSSSKGGAGGGGYWDISGTNIFNTNTGNVGIGTNNPTSKFTIQTPLNTTGWTHIGGNNQIVLDEAIGGISAALGTSTNHAFRLNAGGVGRVHIYPAGEVVVGSNTTGSFGKFTVETLNNSYGISHRGENGNVLATFMGGSSAGFGTFSNTNMRIFANGVSAMFIGSGSNNVGIGIDFPNYKLEVNGTVRSKEVIVETVNWPDYVFDENYKLPLLIDVEKFILQNKHLPNIQSSKEIEEKGLYLGDTQKRMMEKIEELTLYIIQLNKRISELEKNNKR